MPLSIDPMRAGIVMVGHRVLAILSWSRPISRSNYEFRFTGVPVL